MYFLERLSVKNLSSEDRENIVLLWHCLEMTKPALPKLSDDLSKYPTCYKSTLWWCRLLQALISATMKLAPHIDRIDDVGIFPQKITNSTLKIYCFIILLFETLLCLFFFFFCVAPNHDTKIFTYITLIAFPVI